jgi:hypothetical protein
MGVFSFTFHFLTTNQGFVIMHALSMVVYILVGLILYTQESGYRYMPFITCIHFNFLNMNMNTNNFKYKHELYV